MLIVTNFHCLDENGVSYIVKEIQLKKDLGLDKERVKFFHRKFQKKTITLARILREEKSSKIYVFFHKEVPPTKSIKVIHHITSTIEEEKTTFSSILN